MSQKVLIESLSMDLLRVALGLHRGSLHMAKRFEEEALKKETNLEKQPMNDYLKKLLRNSRKIISTNSERTAEDALMYSILFQNFARQLPQG